MDTFTTYKEFLSTSDSLVTEAMELIAERRLDDTFCDGDECDIVHEVIDGIQDVIYYSRAWDIVTSLKNHHSGLLNDVEELVAEITDFSNFSLDAYMTQITYWAYHHLVLADVHTALEELEEAA